MTEHRDNTGEAVDGAYLLETGRPLNIPLLQPPTKE